MRVLVVEDDPSVSAALSSVLTKVGHTCLRISRGGELVPRHREADVVMLDLGLADMDGLEALQHLREVSDMPVIVVTARGDERSTVHALRLGADDYLVKPVRLHELLARLTAVTRRYPGLSGERIQLGELVIDVTAHQVLHDGEEVNLTPTEFALLTAFARHVGTAISRQSIVEEIWGPGYAAKSRSFDVHLGQLRQKLPMLTITTIRGFGFRLETPG